MDQTNGNSIAAVGGDIQAITFLLIVSFIIYAVIHTDALDYVPRKSSKKR